MGDSINSKISRGCCRLNVEKVFFISRRALLKNPNNIAAESVFSYCLTVLRLESAYFPNELINHLKELGILKPFDSERPIIQNE